MSALGRIHRFTALGIWMVIAVGCISAQAAHMADPAPTPTLTERVKSTGTIAVTVLVFILVIVWMVAVWRNLGKAPHYRKDTLSYDEFTRAKDVLVLVLPLLTTAVGYWLGSQGTAAAQKKAETAENKASEAQKQASDAHAESARRQGQLEQLEKTHPQAFRGP